MGLGEGETKGLAELLPPPQLRENSRVEDQLRTKEREAMEGGSTHQRVSIATVMLCILLRVMMVDMLQVFWSIKLA